MSIAVVFPGQGAATPHMGASWVDHPAWKIVDDAEATLDRPLAQLLLEADADELATTRAGQLAVLLCSLMAWDALGEMRSTVEITGMAGHSLGQITALFAAGVVDQPAGFRLAAARADASQDSADLCPGRMVALVGATLDQAHAVCAETDGVWLANDNAPGQIVIAGLPDALEHAAESARANGVRRVMSLSVGHGFHTPLLADAADAWKPVVTTTAFGPTTVPIVTNTDATAHTGSYDWPDELLRHLVTPVRWRESQLVLAATRPDAILEVGPGQVLSSLARRTLGDVEVHHVATPTEAAEVTELLTDRLVGQAALEPTR